MRLRESAARVPGVARAAPSPLRLPMRPGRRASAAAISISGPASPFAMPIRCGKRLAALARSGRTAVTGGGGAAQDRVCVYRPGQPVGRHGAGALRDRARLPPRSSTAAMPCSAKIGTPRCSTPCSVAGARRETLDDPVWKQPLDLRARVRPHGPLEKRGRSPRCCLRPQPGRDRGGAGRGGLQPRGRAQVRGGSAVRISGRCPGPVRWPRSFAPAGRHRGRR